jgi:hypothetical protein
LSAQIVALCERARSWREYGTLLERAGRDNIGAILSAQRDETTAHHMEGGRLTV